MRENGVFIKIVKLSHLNHLQEAKLDQICFQKITRKTASIFEGVEYIHPKLTALFAEETPPGFNPLVMIA